MDPASTVPAVRVKQGDASIRYIHAILTAHGERLIPGAGITIVFRETKPDGTGVLLDSFSINPEYGRRLVVIEDDGSVTIELIKQTTTCAGRCACDLCLMDGEDVISTASFILAVFPSPLTDGLDESSAEYSAIMNIIADLSDLISAFPDLSNLMSGGTTGQALMKTSASDGDFGWASIPGELPDVTTSDNGKILRVVDGAWTAASIQSASGVGF